MIALQICTRLHPLRRSCRRPPLQQCQTPHPSLQQYQNSAPVCTSCHRPPLQRLYHSNRFNSAPACTSCHRPLCSVCITPICTPAPDARSSVSAVRNNHFFTTGFTTNPIPSRGGVKLAYQKLRTDSIKKNPHPRENDAPVGTRAAQSCVCAECSALGPSHPSPCLQGVCAECTALGPPHPVHVYRAICEFRGPVGKIWTLLDTGIG